MRSKCKVVDTLLFAQTTVRFCSFLTFLVTFWAKNVTLVTPLVSPKNKQLFALHFSNFVNVNSFTLLAL